MTTKKKAKLFAQDAAERLKNSLTPYTGRSVKAEVVSYEYHEKLGTFEIDMKAKWNAKGCAFCRRKDHQVNGVLIVDSDESMKFKPSWKNDAVHDTEGWIKKTNLGFVIGTFITLGSDLDE